MKINLLQSPLFDMKRLDGSVRRGSLLDLTEGYRENPVVGIQLGREDMKAWSYLLLVGLFQTEFAPKNDHEWRHLLDNPPTREEIRERLQGSLPLFNLGGDTPFMQDPAVLRDPKTKRLNISVLLSDVAGDSTLNECRGSYLYQEEVDACPGCAGLLLYLCSHGYGASGRGYYTSPHRRATHTLLCGSTLWETVWGNVLTEKQFQGGGGFEYPWENPQKYYKSKAGVLDPEKDSPLLAFWPVVSRVFMHLEEEEGVCSLCRHETTHMVRDISRRYGDGMQFGKGLWQLPYHPLRISNNGKERAKPAIQDFPSPSLRNVMGLAYEYEWESSWKKKDKEQKEFHKFEPAPAVHYLLNSPPRAKQSGRFRLWVFGHAFHRKNIAKLQAWYSGTVPLFPTETSEEAQAYLRQMLVAAHKTATHLRQYVYRGLKIQMPQKEERHLLARQTLHHFWEEVNDRLYTHFSDLVSTMEKGESVEGVMDSWFRSLWNVSLHQYRSHTPYENKDLTHKSLVQMAEQEKWLRYHIRQTRNDLSL